MYGVFVEVNADDSHAELARKLLPDLNALLERIAVHEETHLALAA